MLALLISIIGILITIFFVIGTHEAAHFAAARFLGVKVLRFSIGFGKRLFHWHDKSGTEYVIALIPLGGYVKMLDEGEGDVPKDELPYAYNRQPFYKKFLIVLAGPAINLICAFLLYWLIFFIGFTTVKPIIGEVTPHSIAAISGLKKNQEILSVDDKVTSSWTGILFRLLAHTGDEDQMSITVNDPVTKHMQTYSLDLANYHLDELNPDPLKSLGITPYTPPIPLIIGTIQKDSPAANALQIGDKIIAIDKKTMTDWEMIFTTIVNHPSQQMIFTIERQGKTLNIAITTDFKRSLFLKKSGYLGISPYFEWPKAMQKQVKFNALGAIPRAWQEVVDLTYFNLLLFGKMVTGKLSVQSLGGPITIFSSAGSAFNYGFIPFISFLAFLSLSVGIINFFPIPGLDGGHMFIQIIELIIQRPLPERVLILLFRLGFLFIILIFIQALINDLLRLY